MYADYWLQSRRLLLDSCAASSDVMLVMLDTEECYCLVTATSDALSLPSLGALAADATAAFTTTSSSTNSSGSSSSSAGIAYSAPSLRQLQLRLATLQEACARLAATETELLCDCCDGLLQTVAHFTAQFTAGVLTSNSGGSGSGDAAGGASPRDDSTPLDTARRSAAQEEGCRALSLIQRQVTAKRAELSGKGQSSNGLSDVRTAAERLAAAAQAVLVWKPLESSRGDNNSSNSTSASASLQAGNAAYIKTLQQVEVAQTKLQDALRIVQAVELTPSTATVPTASTVTATAPVTNPFDLRGTDVVLTSSSGTPKLQSGSSSSSSSAVLWSTTADTDSWLQRDGATGTALPHSVSPCYT
eukprot:15403-Heterococcus_DN1.PRE.2